MNEPDFQFRGVWIPAEIMQKLGEGIINPTELCLLALVESKVKMRGEGCWSSSANLGKSCGISARRVRYIVNKLTRLDPPLLIITGTKRIVADDVRRVMITCWSAIGPVAGDLGGRSLASPKQNTTYSNKKLYRNSLARDSEREEKDMAFIGSLKMTIEQRHRLLARVLKKAIKRKFPTKIKQYHENKWAVQFAKLDKTAGETIVDMVLDWYIDHIGEEWVPEAFSAKSFREKFERIEKRMFKDREKNPQITISDLAVEIANK